MSNQDIPTQPTHAVYMIDNSTGDNDYLFVFAYKVDDVFYSYDTNKRLLDYEGDEILGSWSFDT